jgi:hypothetical protein
MDIAQMPSIAILKRQSAIPMYNQGEEQILLIASRGLSIAGAVR